MTEETWLQGKDAVDAGLADELIGASNANARFDLSVFAHAPADLQANAPPASPEIASPFELEKILRSVLSRSQATKVAIGGWNALNESIPTQISALQQRIAAATAKIKGS